MLRGIFGSGGGAPVGGTGTTNTIPRWTGPSTLGDSIVIQGSTANAIGIGNAPTTDLAGYKALEVGGLGSGFVNADNDLWITANAKHSGGGWKYAVAASTPSNSIRANAGAIIFNRAGNGTAGNALTWLESARIDSSGNVGIGTAGPNDRVEVNGNARFTRPNVASQYLQYYGDATYNALVSVSSSKTFALFSDANSAGMLLQTQAAQPIVLSTNNLERARIDSAGNFGLNTSTASSGFATMTLNGTTAGARANNCGLQLNYNTGGFGGGSITTVGAAGGGLDFWTYTGNIGSESYQRIYRIDTSGNLILNTANTGATIQAAGTSQGLKLPATPGNADTQTLDCYQEGTTTCTATAEGGGTITLTAGSDTLRYTRVGRLVTIDGSLTIDSVNIPTGRLRINTNLGAYPGAAAVGMSVRLTGFAAGLTTTPIGQCTNVGNVAAFQIDRFSGAGNITADVAAYAQAGAIIRVSVTFSV